jgi:hypothetical protein
MWLSGAIPKNLGASRYPETQYIPKRKKAALRLRHANKRTASNAGKNLSTE